VTSRDAFLEWMANLESRHFAELTFPEVSRALRALSSTYVERRQKLAEGAALAGAGKRAAFALFYAPLHYFLIEHIATNLAGATRKVPTLVDLGCGTGASGAAWARAFDEPPRVVAIDRHPWAVAEATHTYRAFGIAATVRRGDIATARLPAGPSAILAAFAVNELAEAVREELLRRLLERGGRGDRVLVVEPIAGAAAPWWTRWRQAFESAGGRADEWRVRTELPAIVQKLDRAAGLNHREITGRSLWIAG
jgi:SAM-dependent methyltransferase